MATERQRKMRADVLDWVLAHPDLHDQSSYVDHKEDCGTTLCIAGTAIMIEGINRGIPLSVETRNESQVIDELLVRLSWELNVEADYDDVASTLLGISMDHGEDMFYAGNDGAIRRLKELVNEG